MKLNEVFEIEEDINAVEIEKIIKPIVRRLMGRRQVWETPGKMTAWLRGDLSKAIKAYLSALGIKKGDAYVDIKLTTEDGMSGSMLYNHEHRTAYFTLFIPKSQWKAVKNESKSLDLWEQMVEDIQQTVVHELIHADQWVMSKGKMANRTGFLGKKKDHPGDQTVYLSDKHEISPYAANAIQELAAKDVAFDKLKGRMGEGDVHQYLRSASHTFNRFYTKFKEGDTRRHKMVWNRFLKKLIQHIDDRIVDAEKEKEEMIARAKRRGFHVD